MTQDRDTGPIALVAGLGLAAGAAAFGAFLSSRHRKGEDDAPGYTARKGSGDQFDVIGRTVTIRKPRAELFAFWRDFSNLAAFMENLEQVEAKGKDRAVWTIRAPAGRTVDVETEITEERENEVIAWRSVEGSDISTEGKVAFSDAPGDRGTRVSLIVAYDPPAGELGRAVAKAFLREPEVQARHDLKRFKMLMETGEIATSARRKDQTRAARQENA
ncbi:SRPBCC family protein [Aurantiacibacter spongiae]|uniref:SRPBCC family protein n=1 Tax=Aurantiacibacter spongiae TaxID=2488860 RepID=A0A3N5CR93_9SPHN|nr:SRPBCC family protein [Aurantiacibacter spongiae]RPF71653.1 SRPBCC family protein [Aurantiacibacter spongiae]